ncbi:MAG TPA: thioesterase family protein, partial [Steroidobacteraceae bacterium]|nr:thioesterase family protein [Steroidobacteraceae bacterium]
MSAQTYRGVVYPWQCDHMGHMNVMWYVGKFDEATWQLFAALGVTATYLQQQGKAMAAVDQRIAYRRELHAGDVISVRSVLIELRTTSIRFVHEMRHDETGELITTTLLTGVHLESATRKSSPLPEE